MFDDTRARFFPYEPVPGFVIRASDPAELSPIWAAQAGRAERPFGELGNYEMPAEREWRAERLAAVYAATQHEFFLFATTDGQPAGWATGAMIDASTFFMAWTVVLPEYRRRGLYTAYLGRLLPYLHALGYERVTSNHMVNNRPVLIAKLKAGFVITGMVLDERYGAQVALSYFFHPDRRVGFARAYSLADFD